ncbi:MAG: hypothetical protein HY369_01905 [Candidatus Aenigmarchaeota archaeon]|nr:hypothetical protein [Candidatus Aenigmarchaeota archaeon]
MVKKIVVDRGVSLTASPDSTKYELNDIKRAWVDCELTNGETSEITLIIEGINRGRYLTISIKKGSIETRHAMIILLKALFNLLQKKPFNPIDSSGNICILSVDELEILGALHKIKDMGGLDI